MPANTIELEGRFEEVASLVRKALSLDPPMFVGEGGLRAE